jgi:hypothetical protein
MKAQEMILVIAFVLALFVGVGLALPWIGVAFDYWIEYAKWVKGVAK